MISSGDFQYDPNGTGDNEKSQDSNTMPETSSIDGEGLLRLAKAIATNNQHNENRDIVAWLETASIGDLRLAFKVLLNWCRNATKKAAKAAAKEASSDETEDPIELTTTISTEEVVQKIVEVLENAIEYGTEGEKSNDEIAVIDSLRMALAGYLHTNHHKMRKIPAVANLEKRTKAKIALDSAATNTLDLVNLASPTPMSVSQYVTPEEEKESKGWAIPAVQIDLGLGFQQTSPADICEEFIKDEKQLLHPFTGQKVGRMGVKKVIPSKRKPVWIEYFSETEAPLKPDSLAKQGDDLRNDASVACVSKLCETILAKAPIEWTLGGPPTVCAYDVLVTAPDGGYLEMVPGKNFLDLSNKPGGWNEVNIIKLAPSLVGAYIVNFILGVRDRHEDNMMVVGNLQENPRMMQIDFGYVLMEFPGGVHYDMPRLTMPIPLVDRLNSEPSLSGKNSTLMEDLQQDMLAAYLVLRRHSQQLIPFCSHLMSSSYDYKYVKSVLKGRHCFRTNSSEKAVIQWMSQKLINQWAHFYFRREIKLGMVKAYYKFVELTTFENNSDKITSTTEKAVSLKKKIKRFFKPKKAKPPTPKASGSGSSDSDEDHDDDERAIVCQDSNDIENISQLNERVSTAMKINRTVSQTMISQSQQFGSVELDDDDEDDAEGTN